MKEGAVRGRGLGIHAAADNHMEVSKALLIIGMFMPKFALAFAFELLFEGALVLTFSLWAVSVARSHDPCS